MKTNMGKVFVAFLCMMMCLSLNAQDLTPGMVVGPPFSRSAALK